MDTETPDIDHDKVTATLALRAKARIYALAEASEELLDATLAQIASEDSLTPEEFQAYELGLRIVRDEERVAFIEAQLLEIRTNYRIDGPSQQRRTALLAEGRELTARVKAARA